MHDLLSQISGIKRPRLLIRAARIAAQDYRRAARLPRLLGYGVLPRTGPALIKLMSLEAEMNDRRENGDAGYRVAEHVEILTALMGETCLLKSQSEPPKPGLPT